MKLGREISGGCCSRGKVERKFAAELVEVVHGKVDSNINLITLEIELSYYARAPLYSAMNIEGVYGLFEAGQFIFG